MKAFIFHLLTMSGTHGTVVVYAHSKEEAHKLLLIEGARLAEKYSELPAEEYKCCIDSEPEDIGDDEEIDIFFLVLTLDIPDEEPRVAVYYDAEEFWV